MEAISELASRVDRLSTTVDHVQKVSSSHDLIGLEKRLADVVSSFAGKHDLVGLEKRISEVVSASDKKGPVVELQGANLVHAEMIKMASQIDGLQVSLSLLLMLIPV